MHMGQPNVALNDASSLPLISLTREHNVRQMNSLAMTLKYKAKFGCPGLYGNYVRIRACLC